MLTGSLRWLLLVVALSTASFGRPNAEAQSLDTISLKHPATTFDERLLISINHWGLSAPSLDGPMLFLSNTAAIPVITTPIGIYVTGLLNHDRAAAISGLSIGVGEGLSGLVSQGIKLLVRRDRPYHVLEDVRSPEPTSEAGCSFPSAHATAVWSMAAGLGWQFPKWYVIAPAAIYAVAVSLSRPYLGVHYVSDLIGGAVVGIGCSYLVYRLQDRLANSLPGILPGASASGSSRASIPETRGYRVAISIGMMSPPRLRE